MQVAAAAVTVRVRWEVKHSPGTSCLPGVTTRTMPSEGRGQKPEEQKNIFFLNVSAGSIN